MLTTDQCRQADKLMIAKGVVGTDLMAQAGLVVARVIQSEYPDREIALLVGPGNNGGDALVAAMELQQVGFTVRLASYAPLTEMSGDAKHFVDQWSGEALELLDFFPKRGEVIVDGLFGAGYRGSLSEVVRRVFSRCHGHKLIAIDVPSGIDGNTGKVSYGTLECDHTVTFFRLKAGHILHPGRDYCGVTHVCDIGIDDSCLDKIKPNYWYNHQPDFNDLVPDNADNKYSRGTLAIVASSQMRGATQLCARAAQRAGSGMVIVLSPVEAVYHYQQSLASVPTRPCKSPNEIIENLRDSKVNAIALGAGLVEIEDDPGLLEMIVRLEKPMVLDASALSALAQHKKMLAERTAPLVITPHAGEFSRLFPDLDIEDLPQALIIAARQLHCVIVYKGHTTLIASYNGRVVFNINAHADLATAGSGDVLTGMIGSLLAQGCSATDSACYACWWHAEAGKGFGLIAEDIVEAIPRVVRYHINQSKL